VLLHVDEADRLVEASRRIGFGNAETQRWVSLGNAGPDEVDEEPSSDPLVPTGGDDSDRQFRDVLSDESIAVGHLGEDPIPSRANRSFLFISTAVLGLGVASTSSKQAAYKELNKVVQGLARHQTWKQLNEKVITQIVQKAFTRFGFDLTKRRLAAAVPVVGIAVASGLNARTLLSVISNADDFYRERLLSERYGVSLDVETASTDQPALGLYEIIDAEVVDDAEETHRDR
jgi:hypothetical protein